MFNIKTPKFLSRVSTNLRRLLVARLLDLRNKVCLGKKFSPGSTTRIRVYDLVNAGPRHRFTTAQFLVSNCLGLGYGCGWEKFITLARSLVGLDITADDPEFETVVNPRTGEETQRSGWGKRSREIVRDYRARHPKQVGLWKRLNEEFEASGCRSEDFTVVLPSGRKLTYRNVRRQVQHFLNDEGKPEARFVFAADAGRPMGHEIFYGGKLTENLVQAVARDVFAEQMRDIHYKHGLTTLFSCHDELILEVDKSVTAKDVETLMSTTPEWLSGCPIAAEAKEVDRYCK